MSKIEWTNATWNPLVGCDKCSPGCAHCYAATMAKRLRAMALADIAAGCDPGRKRHYIEAVDEHGRWTGKLIPVPEALADPLGWKKPRMIFVNSMSDLFHDAVEAEWIARVFFRMYECQWHTFQVLTKRPSRMASLLSNPRMPHAMACVGWDMYRERSPERAEYVTVGDLERDIAAAWPLSNVWLGTSCEDQQRADERIPWLLKTPAAVRFVSAEPLLGPINFEGSVWVGDYMGDPDVPGGTMSFPSRPMPSLDWVIVGGESGHSARACNIAWIRDIVGQCRDVEIPVFVKQLGPMPYEGSSPYVSGPEAANCKLYELDIDKAKGGDPAEWPEDLRVRQFPALPGLPAPKQDIEDAEVVE